MSIEVARNGDRLFLRHGPTDIVAICDRQNRDTAFQNAIKVMDGVIDLLVQELSLLRCFDGPCPEGPVATCMWDAAQPWTDVPVTPMAAVAGAVADHVLAAMIAAGARRAAVNNGGDIAVHLAPGQSLTLAIAGLDGSLPGRIRLTGGDGVGGVATSGRRGRSLTRGIADSVTVLAATAAMADVAATLIANAVDLPGNPGISRLPAFNLQPDSDLKDLEVVIDVAALTADDVSLALSNGRRTAEDALRRGLILGAALRLGDQMICVGQTEHLLKDAAHA